MLPEQNLKPNITAKADEHLNEIDQFTKALALIKENSLENFLADKDLRKRAERNFHGALESAMAVGSLLIVNSRGELPNNYEAIFDVLGSRRIISLDLAERLRKLEDFHNILIHGKIENWQKVFDQLERVEDFKEFVRQVRDYISGK